MPNPHPLIVHFPIALFILAVACELTAYFYKSKLLSVCALVASIGAVLGAIAAVVTGLFAKGIVPKGSQAQIVVGSHETMGFIMLACAVAFTALKLWCYFREDDRVLTPLIAVGLVGVVVTIITAHEGGQLVFDYGVGVQKAPPVNPLKAYPYGSESVKKKFEAVDSSGTGNSPDSSATE